ncbi:hypothetical protein BH10PLA2_BH10PLA2_27220 [soil metagenome]
MPLQSQGHATRRFRISPEQVATVHNKSACHAPGILQGHATIGFQPTTNLDGIIERVIAFERLSS